ncbi:hypothetical protein PHSY_005990 [Pseudozyma hubeiensis SY62]|uniref:Galactose oxidase n=1 Tax=Pseudozyma hubeiensis (strain SY62) TaxID=1305764 RepID=R9PAK6_PSEHS|nr:hypothetical protein PHSY_005990 [Pseudozyma hubeiensis SY62]GAC98396.1 hypothetical protein PHSY_005990 [Pseudozyma hubeiensis SY62]
MHSAILLALAFPLIAFVSAQDASSPIPARWGQASALLGSLLIVQGGKTQGTTGGGYTYNSAPNDAQMYTLDLSFPFALSSPPWQSVSTQSSSNAAPPVSFHTISPLNSTSLLLFGGDGSPLVPVPTGNDSAYIIHLGGSQSNRTAAYQPVPASWNQPMRRMHHTSESNAQGSVWIIGGERADGSGLIFDQQWTIDTTSTSPSFQLISSPPPGSLVGSTSTMLSDGTLLLLGGLDASGQLQSMQNLYAYSSKSKTWSQTVTQTSANSTISTRQSNSPAPRRGHIAVSLPNQRVFIQGGASADLSTVYSDAWILDWSVNPPIWSMIDSTDGPGQRFGHSAVAYGREILISFGWAGGNAATSGLHVFDASTLTPVAASKGSWSGGSWSATNYTPDPQMSTASTAPSSGTSSQPSSESSSGSSATPNGSSSSSGGDLSSPSSNSNSGGSSTPSDTNAGSATFPTGNNAPGDGGSANTDSAGSGSSAGSKAGAAVGALLGVGLVLGGGYAVYRRRALNNYRRYGNGSVGLLGFGDRRAGESADDDLLMEKGYSQSDYDRPYHRAGGAGAVHDVAELTGGLAYGRRRGRNEGSPWAAANLGHAMEGSGPHFRERIAIIAGRGKRDTHLGPRFDMLADEGDSVFRPHDASDLNESYDHDLDEADDPEWHDRRVREHSYAHVGEEDLSMGDLGCHQHEEEYHNEDDMYSPFEDRPEDTNHGQGMLAAVATGLFAARGYGKLANRDLEGSWDDNGRSDDAKSDLDIHEGPSSGPSVQSHSTTSRSDVPSSSKSYDMLASAGMLSFSDASHGRQSGQITMKRSPTWWDRFMGNSLVERSSSGRFSANPHGNTPIRDPAPPPVSGLVAIAESPRSRDVSEAYPQDPFADSSAANHTGGLDEMGRRVGSQTGEEAPPYSAHSQGGSLSTIGSARTGASSHFESRLRGMDVIQRVRTGSSRRTHSTRAGSSISDTDSEAALSRGPTLLRPRNIASSEALRDDAQSTPGSVVWKPEDFHPTVKGLEDLVEENGEDVSSNTHLSPPTQQVRRQLNVSETPSITPLTTKRARLNPVMVSPLFPSTNPQRQRPTATTSSSVKDKVKAFESVTADTTTSAWNASLSSVKSNRIAHASEVQKSIERTTSPAGSMASRTRKVVTHGLVPRAQLFVANPDNRGSEGSGDTRNDS